MNSFTKPLPGTALPVVTFNHEGFTENTMDMYSDMADLRITHTTSVRTEPSYYSVREYEDTRDGVQHIASCRIDRIEMRITQDLLLDVTLSFAQRPKVLEAIKATIKQAAVKDAKYRAQEQVEAQIGEEHDCCN